VIKKGIPYETESWGWLLDPAYKGKVGIVNAPTIGIFDLALAAQARGLMRFTDISNMTIAEIDTLFGILIALKKQKHFAGFWNTVPQSVDFMTSGRVVIESMFSPGVSAANGKGTPVTYAAPKEGYRAWQRARRGIRIHELVVKWLGGCVYCAPRLLHIQPRAIPAFAQ
jgi:putative spermidine/putrescine transport system substrate-binding protein